MNLNYCAVRTEMPDGRKLFAFPVVGNTVFEFAGLGRARRSETGEVEGFQRQEVKKHVNDIAHYIDQPDSMIPNAIVVAFKGEAIHFESIDSPSAENVGQVGVLSINIPADPDVDRPGWIVDGQQRSFALEKAEKELPIMVCAFVCSDDEQLSEQFVNVNSTKPLPRTLLNELLPKLANVPQKLRKTKFAAMFAQHLINDDDSAWKGIVKSDLQKGGVVTLNSLIKPFENLLGDAGSYVGCMVDAENMVGDLDRIVNVYKSYWLAVKKVFPDAWALKPSQSRLMHGSGIWALMQMSTLVIDDVTDEATVAQFESRLRLIEPFCCWTEDRGDWLDIDGFGRDVEWKSFQNTAQDKRMLTAYLTRKYREERRNG